MNIYYYIPANDKPSWGIGMIYYHVWLLKKNSFNSFVLYDKKPFKISWLKLNVEIKYLDEQNLQFNEDDVLVIPEISADNYNLQKIRCKKIVFVQNAFYIYEGLTSGKTYEDLGISTIFYYMPHLKRILNNITKIPLYETPPFIAPYFFLDNNNNRKRQIILYPKFNNKEYDILKRYLYSKLNIVSSGLLNKITNKSKGWEIIELVNKKHVNLPKIMNNAMFFATINTTEAFNSAVPEAMASGCINFCFEAVGPADFLENGRNAYVFKNDHVYELAEKLVNRAISVEKLSEEFDAIRTNAYKLAKKYTIDVLEKRIVLFFNEFV